MLVQYNPPHTLTSYRVILNNIWPFPQKHLWSRYEVYYNIYMQVRLTAIPNYIGECITIPSGLNIPVWRSLLKDYHDKELPDFLEYRWPVDYTGDAPPLTTMANHYNDQQSVAHMTNYIKTELAHGSLLGPFTSLPFSPWTQVSPMMTREKSPTDPRHTLRVRDITPHAKGLIVSVRSSKASTKSSRLFNISVASMPDSAYCSLDRLCVQDTPTSVWPCIHWCHRGSPHIPRIHLYNSPGISCSRSSIPKCHHCP